jgi:hypothetical protein
MKYRYLTQEELQLLEEELVQFLIVNGIDGPEWEKINKTSPDKARELVGMFSDVVVHRSLEKVKFGEQGTRNRFFIFAFHKEEIELLGCICKNDALDISTFDLLFKALKNYPSEIELFRQTKKYQPNREQEIFTMMNNGLLLSEQSRFDLLQKLYSHD